MKNLSIILLSVIVLASCNEKSFSYNRQTACEINYGTEGFSVIVDGGNILVKNNSQLSFGKIFSISTADKRYTTLGRYFNSEDSRNIVVSLSRSITVYLKWTAAGSLDSSGEIRQGMVNVSDFTERFDSCVEQQSRL